MGECKPRPALAHVQVHHRLVARAHARAAGSLEELVAFREEKVRYKKKKLKTLRRNFESAIGYLPPRVRRTAGSPSCSDAR